MFPNSQQAGIWQIWELEIGIPTIVLFLQYLQHSSSSLLMIMNGFLKKGI